MQTPRVAAIGAIVLAYASSYARAQPTPTEPPASAPAPTPDAAPASATVPDASKPDPSRPDASRPDASRPDASRPGDELDPFTFADFTWQSGNARTKDSVLGNKYFTGEFRIDDVFHYSLNRPKDDTIGGSTEAWRHAENQVTQLGIGGDFHWDNVQGRLMTQFGQLATTPPRNDASPARGQWQLDNAYRYLHRTQRRHASGRQSRLAGIRRHEFRRHAVDS
jgi:hypothetical protein